VNLTLPDLIVMVSIINMQFEQNENTKVSKQYKIIDNFNNQCSKGTEYS
jgi:hypothetical protein